MKRNILITGFDNKLTENVARELADCLSLYYLSIPDLTLYYANRASKEVVLKEGGNKLYEKYVNIAVKDAVEFESMVAAADFTDLPMELDEFNVLAAAVRDMPSPEKQLPKLKALLKQFEVQDIATAISLTECLDDYVLTPEISSPQETAIDQLHFMTDDHSVELLISHVNLYAYGCDLIREDNAVLSPYGLLHRADYQPMLTPVQEKMEMTMR